MPWPQPLAASGSTRTSFTVLALPFHPCHANNHPPPASLGVPLCLTTVRFTSILIHHHYHHHHSYLHPRPAISPARRPSTRPAPFTHLLPRPPSPHLTSLHLHLVTAPALSPSAPFRC